MKKTLITVFASVLITAGLFAGCAADADMLEQIKEELQAEDTQSSEAADFGAKGAMEQSDLTIEQMLLYAIQDEYLARQEYESIMEEFGEQQPFSNIIKAEEMHIEWLKELFVKYGYEIPKDDAIDHLVMPGSIEEALELGVQAEIDNIAMYEMFMEQELPDDILAIFTELRDASENHLAAFEKGPRGMGNGRQN